MAQITFSVNLIAGWFAKFKALVIKHFLLIIFFFLLTVQSHVLAGDLCDIIEMPNCAGISRQIRRASSASLPSTSSASNINPANVSFEKGLGFETIIFPGNSPTFNFVTGTGKSGGALLSPSMENSFFGNRVVEIDQVYLERRLDEEKYKSNKFTLALGRKIFSNRNFGLDLGLILKQHSKIKRVNPGLGLSSRLGPFSFGASYYYDDLYLKLASYVDPETGTPYSVTYNDTTYQEQFKVLTYSAGVRIKNLSLDAGMIKTKYNFYTDDTQILIYSAAFHYENFLVNVGLRDENSPAYKYQDKTLVKERKKKDTFVSGQYSINKHFLVGLNYNYFLMHEISFTATLFL